MIIGFDFDKVFIDYPPLVPNSVIDFLYKGTSGIRRKKNKSKLQYRIPGNIEQQIRILSHYPIFRKPIKDNVAALKKIRKDNNCKTYLVSSRFGFLRKRTDVILKKNKLNNCFDGLFFNFQNKQPHLFKEQTIKKLNIDTYIDDDIDLALYLSSKIPSLKIFWIQDDRNIPSALPKNITPVKKVRDILKFIKK